MLKQPVSARANGLVYKKQSSGNRRNSANDSVQYDPNVHLTVLVL